MDDVIYQSRFLKEKLATIVVELAKKVWPTEWPDFARLLQDLYGSGVGYLSLAGFIRQGTDFECRYRSVVRTWFSRSFVRWVKTCLSLTMSLQASGKRSFRHL